MICRSASWRILALKKLLNSFASICGSSIVWSLISIFNLFSALVSGFRTTIFMQFQMSFILLLLVIFSPVFRLTSFFYHLIAVVIVFLYWISKTLMHYWQEVLKVMKITGQNPSSRIKDSQVRGRSYLDFLLLKNITKKWNS